MKIGIGCDHILERDKSIEMVEALCAIFPEAELYTVAHRPGQVLGPLEKRKIHSTYLSHKVSSKKELYQKSYLVPGALKGLNITCSLDLFIDVSAGFAHGMTSCCKTKRISYILDKREEEPKGLLNWFFRAFLRKWRKESLLKERTLWVETPELQKSLEELGKKALVLRPFVKIEDFKVIKSAGFSHQAFLVNASALDEEKAMVIGSSLKEKNLQFKFIGTDEHLKSIKQKLGEEHFFGDRCHGELAPLMSSAAGLVDFDSHPYSSFTLECLASGRPVLKYSEKISDELDGLVCFDSLNEMIEKLPKLSHESWDEKSEDLRRGVVKFNEGRFKSQVKKFLSEA